MTGPTAVSSTPQLMVAVRDLGAWKKLATGAPLATFPGDARLDGTFAEVVSAVWGWYGESLKEDLLALSPFLAPSEKQAVTSFGTTLRRQRHAHQHPETFNEIEQARRWRAEVFKRAAPVKEPETGQALVDAFLRELAQALKSLASCSARVARIPIQRDAWTERIKLSPEDVVRGVYADLGRCPPVRELGYVTRQFISAPERKSVATPEGQREVAVACVLRVTVGILPVGYIELLESAGLVGHPDAPAFLLIASAVAKDTSLRRSRYVERVLATWSASLGEA